MQCLEPRSVELKDSLHWFKQAFELISRRLLTYGFSIAVFFSILFFASQSVNTLSETSSPIIFTAILVLFSAFIFFFILAKLILVSHCADNSRSFDINALFSLFIPNQKVFFKMSALAVLTGFFFWYITIFFHPEKNILTSSESIMAMLANSDSVIYFLLTENATFLYFSLIVFFIFRTFFSIPLILFHQLDYKEAKQLSHKGLVKNINVMFHVLAVWVVIFMTAITLAPALAILMLPLFATYMYVSFRHIYWGQGTNESAKEVNRQVIASKAL